MVTHSQHRSARGRGRWTSHERSGSYTSAEIAHRLGLSRAAVESAIGEIIDLSPRIRGVEGAVLRGGHLDLSQARVSARLLSLIRVLATDD